MQGVGRCMVTRRMPPWTWGGVNSQRRFVVGKASNRAGVHGSQLPDTDTVDKEAVEKEINKGKKDKQDTRNAVEQAVDSHLNSSQDPTTSPTK